MATLKEKGYRFMVRPDLAGADWIHPVELAIRAPDWFDCTDMDDAAFDAFMGVPIADRQS